jgi:PhzF family phenazine biosynthesis protein
VRIFQVDAFTAVPFTGNPATVILDADGHSDAMLAAIGREFPQAETAFVLAATAPDHDVRLRFFNARQEAAFVGHATIAAHAVLLAVNRRDFGTTRQLSGTGIIAVQTQSIAGTNLPLIEFRQTTPQMDAPMNSGDALRVASALGLSAADLDPARPVRVARKGSSRLLFPVAHPAVLNRITPHLETLVALGQALGVEGYFAFSWTEDGGKTHTDSRMFCPALGIAEDPVSGNAHAMLAAYLWELGVFGKRFAGFTGRQGFQMRRPGSVEVTLEIERDLMVAARIGGTAVIISDGRLLQTRSPAPVDSNPA